MKTIINVIKGFTSFHVLSFLFLSIAVIIMFGDWYTDKAVQEIAFWGNIIMGNLCVMSGTLEKILNKLKEN